MIGVWIVYNRGWICVFVGACPVKATKAIVNAERQGFVTYALGGTERC